MLDDLIIKLEVSREHGMAVAFLVGGVYRLTEIGRANNQSEYYLSMKDMAEATGMSYRQVREAAKKAKEAGLLDYRQGYKPRTTVKTTYWELLWEGFNRQEVQL